MKRLFWVYLPSILWLAGSRPAARAETVVVRGVKIVINHNDLRHANPGFYFSEIPKPSTNDAAASATFAVTDGNAGMSGGLDALHDGKTPAGFDQPERNFFFNHGEEGGWVRVDLGRVIPVQAVRTYSCHPSTRAPQIYTLYGSDGGNEHFKALPRRGDRLEQLGWTQIADIRTGLAGGQWAVSVSGDGACLGRFRYLLFAMRRTEKDDPFGNTFYSEIDVISQDSPEAKAPRDTLDLLSLGRGKYTIAIDTSEAPELTDWARAALAPAVAQWYPKLVGLLPSEGFAAPSKVRIQFRGMGAVDPNGGRIVAFTRGDTIICGEEWFRQNLRGEAIGSVIHELVHVVQHYRGGAPGWWTEGIADYIRWFLFEPQSHGAEITAANLNRAHYDAGYRVTANFLNWVAGAYGQNVLVQLNAAARTGEYRDALWNKLTGHSVDDLGRDWRAALAKKLNATIAP